MKKLFVSLAALASVLAFASAAQAQSGHAQIHSGASGPGMCLGVKENDLSHPFMAKCAGYVAENWTVGFPNDHGFVRLQSQRTGPDVCLGVAAVDPSTVKMATCASVKNQQWKLTPAQDGEPSDYFISSQLSGPAVCLGIRPNTNTSELDMNACHGYPGQVWTVNP